jgi:hypothetical protein
MSGRRSVRIASRRENLRQHALWLAFVPLLAPSVEAALEPKADTARENELSSYRKTAEDLYNATTSDAHTFERAITAPEVRKEVERVFKRKLSDEQLRGMAVQARAEADYWSRYLQGIERAAEAERRIPGQPPPAEPVEPIENPAAILPPQAVSPSASVAVPDRWRILDALGRQENVFDPYNTNTLKADKPVFGEDWFINVGAISDTLYQPSRDPIPVASQPSPRPGSGRTVARYGQSFFSQTEILTLSLIKGDTAFKPPDLELRVTPAFNFNHTAVGEPGIINFDPRAGTVRNDTFAGLQEAFVDHNLRSVSEYFDFDSLRVGIQPFNVDFRGFLFQDNQLGIRLFGDRDANRWQYNLAFFRPLFKDTNSGLNDLGEHLRKDNVLVANFEASAIVACSASE